MKKLTFISLLVLLFPALFLVSCLGKPDNVIPVTNFQADKYLGKWYEIARLDFYHEKGLNQVTATYSLREDGGIKVLNRGYLSEKDRWRESEGKAYFVEDKNTGYLKVSFFGPFYSSYVIFDLDPSYQYALVTGSNKSYLWILARTPTISGEVKASLLAKAAALGFDTDKLLYVEQTETSK
ncbi:MAG: lipocalin [Chitinophagaceae bacterium]|nr:MAG: lipocalin [Chitinophagaceae bacterium]